MLGGKSNKHEYEAAKILGLNASEVEEFVNPVAGMDKSICHDLE